MDPVKNFLRPITDRGRRLSEAVTLAGLAGGRGKWIAARLSDGRTDGNVYDTRADAIRHQLHETQCAYVMVPPDGAMPEADATAFLEVNEKAYDAGYRLSDPSGAAPMLTSDQMPEISRAARRRMLRESRRPR